MSSEPPRRPPYQPPAGGGAGGGGGSYSYPRKPLKRPRDTGAGRGGGETADAEAAEAAANARAPPNLRQLRRDNARRWEEVVRLRGRLVQREPTHGPVGDGNGDGQSQQHQDQREINANHNSSNRLGPLDRRLAAHRAELALLVQPQQQQQQEEEQQQQQSERNVRAVQAHRSMIQNARRHQAQLYGNEIVETYDGLVQLHAHLDRTIGVVAPRADADEDDDDDAEENGTANADSDGRVARDGAEDRDVLTLHDRIAEAEARVAEHRLVHTALVDMLQRRRGNGAQDTATCSDGSAANEDIGGTAAAAAAAAAGEMIVVDEPDEAQRIHAEMVYFAQRFDAHLDRMEEVAATAAQEEREGDTLSDDEDGGGNDVEGSANRAADNDASDRTAPTGTTSRTARSSSTSSSSSSSQNPFLATLFVGLARRAVSNREDPYVSLEATIGGSGGGNSSRGRNRRIQRRRRIVDHLLVAGVLTRHSDNPDLICFNYFE